MPVDNQLAKIEPNSEIKMESNEEKPVQNEGDNTMMMGEGEVKSSPAKELKNEESSQPKNIEIVDISPVKQ